MSATHLRTRATSLLHRLPGQRILRRCAPDLAVAVVLLALPLALFAPVTLGARTIVPYDALLTDPVYRPAIEARGVARPQNGLVADLVFQNLVWKSYLVDRVRAGRVPLWNPELAGGMPFLAAGQHSALYPLTLLFLALPPDRAFGWNAVLNLWLAGLSMFVLGRTLRLGRFPSAWMGAAWSLSPLFVANAVFPMIQAGMTWLPLILAGILAVTEAVAAKGRARAAGRQSAGRQDFDQSDALPAPTPWLPRGRAVAWLIAIGVATALSALAGHPEILLYNALVAAAFASFRTALVWRVAGPRAALPPALWLAGAAVAGGLIAAVQLAPLAELASTNWRQGSETYATIAGYAYGLRQAVTFLVPDFYGNPAHHVAPGFAGGAPVALAGDAMWGTDYGTKNYVEAAGYAGVLVLVLAAIGLVAGRRRRMVWFLAALAVVSLTFAFGLPTYRLLFALPGFSQLHTPFRWVYPLNLALVVLAGLGLDRLVRRPPAPRAASWVGGGALAGGATLGLTLALAWFSPRAWTGLVERLFLRLPPVEAGGGSRTALEVALGRFPDAAALAAYEYWNLMHLAVFLILAGVTVLLLVRRPAEDRSRHWIPVLAGAVVVFDLGTIGFGFNPAVDRALDPERAENRPPAVAFLRDAAGAKWGRAVGFGPDRVLWPNSAMRAGIPDLRAYDSILPWWTVEVLDAIESQGLHTPGGPLTYNRIGNLTRPEALAHPALAMLGGRYIVSRDPLDGAALGLRQVFNDGQVRVYENERAMARAWVVHEVKVIARDRTALLAELGRFDPATTALLEETPNLDIWAHLPPGRDVNAPINVRRDSVDPNAIEVDVPGTPAGGLLVLSDAWFPGWRAEVEVAGPEGPQTRVVPVYRANGMLRAVPVPPGRSTVRLTYFPLSVKAGLYGSFLGAILLVLAAAYALWGRFVRVDAGDEVGRIAVNTAGPVAANLLNKVILLAFSMLMYRVLGPEDTGAYTTAITIIGFADIITNFGLNLLATREVARAPEAAPRYLTGTIALRLVLWVLAVPALAGYVTLANRSDRPLSPETVWAIALFAVGLVPSNLCAAISSLFQARERMVLPAGVSIVSTLVSVSAGALALLAGYGFVGLAAVSIVTNVVTLAILAGLARREGIRAARSVPPAFVWGMVGVSLPLMLNHLLQSIFFKIDILLLRQLLREGETVVGWYSTAYKWIDALLILPAFFTMALFPMMSRRAMGDREGLARAWAMGQRWLVSLALPVAVATTFLADGLVTLLAGAEFVPEGSTALRVMIWFLPLSFANGLTQYVLVAVNRQRWITVGFVAAVLFNLAANWLVIPGHTFGPLTIPAYTYVGAAVVTILSEAVLRVPFGRGLADLGAPPLVVILWRPAIAAAAMTGLIGGLDALGVPALASVAAGVPVYVGLLVALGGVTGEDRAILARVWPS